MTNPLDHNFFKFLIGFVFILGISFGLIYVAGTYSAQNETNAYLISQ